MVKVKAERVSNHVPTRPLVRRNHLAETTSRGSAPRAINALFGILHLVVSIRVARATLAKSASFSMLTLLQSARGDPGKNRTKEKNQRQVPTLPKAGRSPRCAAGRLGGRRPRLV